MTENASLSPVLRKRLQEASLLAARLQGQKAADAATREQLAAEVAAAKGRLGLGEEVSRIFNALQERAHERSVGAFERLLTAILHDVLPDEGNVRMLPQFKANTTWLDVALEKNGALEDVVDGNGGAVTNVICAGLRFAALSRTQNRRLMILDEPDCWLKPERVPAFVRVVAQVSAQTRTQTFFITHHAPSFFEGEVNLVRFYADENGKVHAQALAPVVNQWESDEQPGLRSIELINFRRHEHTVIPCFPGATAFIGDNNLGKSTAIVNSFKALAYGESDDSMIRHGCEEARIVFHLENGRRLEWSRSRKRSPAVLYRLYEAGNPVPVEEGRPPARNQAPEWVSKVLGVQRVDDLDIQLGNQKSPVFLLNETASRRAQILSIGREASHLKTMMKRYESLRDADREVEKFGEAKIARLDFRLARMEKLTQVQEKLSELFIEGDDLLTALEQREQLARVLERLERMNAQAQRLARESDALAELPAQAPVLVDLAPLQRLIEVVRVSGHYARLPAVPEVPQVPLLQDLTALTRLTQSIERSARRSVSVALPELPEAPELTDTLALRTMGLRLRTLTDQVTRGAMLPKEIPQHPELSDVAGIETVMSRLTRAAAQVAATAAELVQVERDCAQAEQDYEQSKQDCGGLCPLCGAGFPDAYKGNEQQHDHVH